MTTSVVSTPLARSAVAVTAFFGAAAALLRVPNADLGWFLHMAGEVLDGARPYVDFVDPNPPLVLLLNFPAVALSRWLGTPLGPTYTAWVAIVVAGCLLLALRVLRRIGSPPATDVLLPVMLAFAVFVLPRADFGQREHLAIALTIPFLLLFGSRSAPVSPRLAVVVGLVAGVGFALKPFFLIPWLLVEAEARLVRHVGVRRDVRNLASGAVVAVLLCYGLAVLALTPAYVTAVRTLVLPSYPYYYPVPVGILLQQLPVLVALGAIVLFVAAGWWADEPLGRVLGLASIGFLASLLLQGKGYSYHFYPPLALTAVMVPLLLARFRGYGGVLLPHVLSAARHLVTAALVLACVAAIASARASRQAFRTGPYARLLTVYQTYARDRAVLALGRGTEAGFPMVAQAGARWALPVPMIWPAVSRAVWRAGRRGAASEPPGLRAAERYIRSAVDQAVAARPAVVVVDRAPIVTAAGVADPDFADFFAGDEALRRMLDEYRDLGRVGTYDVYVLDSAAAVVDSPKPIND